MLNFYEENGIVLWRFDPENPNLQDPIKDLPNGLPPETSQHLEMIFRYIEMVRIMLGINESQDGSMPDPETLSHVMETAIRSSNNATQAIDGAYEYIFTEVCYATGLLLQDLVEKKKLHGVIPAIGDDIERIIEVDERISLADMGLVIEKEMGPDEKAALESDIQAGFQSKTLLPEDAFKVRQIKNLKKAQLYLAAVRRQREQQMQQVKQQDIQTNAQVQQQSALQAHQMKLQEIESEALHKQRLSAQEHQQKMAELAFIRETEVITKSIVTEGHVVGKQLDRQGKIESTQLSVEKNQKIE